MREKKFAQNSFKVGIEPLEAPPSRKKIRERRRENDKEEKMKLSKAKARKQ